MYAIVDEQCSYTIRSFQYGPFRVHIEYCILLPEAVGGSAEVVPHIL